MSHVRIAIRNRRLVRVSVMSVLAFFASCGLGMLGFRYWGVLALATMAFYVSGIAYAFLTK